MCPREASTGLRSLRSEDIDATHSSAHFSRRAPAVAAFVPKPACHSCRLLQQWICVFPFPRAVRYFEVYFGSYRPEKLLKAPDMDQKKLQLVEIAGADAVSDAPAVLESFAKDRSCAPPIRPRYVVWPQEAAQVQALVRWANRTATPLVPVSSGPPRSYGDTVPSVAEAVIVNLERMKAILKIDRRNRIVAVEPGVTYAELEPALAGQGLRIARPLLPRANKSVVASLLERQPTTIPRLNYSLPEPLRVCGVVWGTGDLAFTGEAGLGPLSLEAQWNAGLAQVNQQGPLLTDLMRLLTGAQGTMGIVVWASIKCQLLPSVRREFLAAAPRIEELAGFCRELERLKLGDEVLMLNRARLAAASVESSLGKADSVACSVTQAAGRAAESRELSLGRPDMRAPVGVAAELAAASPELSLGKPDMWAAVGVTAGLAAASAELSLGKPDLPPWSVLIGAAGSALYPEEKLGQQEKELHALAHEFGLQLDTASPEVAALLTACSVQTPSQHDIFFLSTLDRVPEFAGTVLGMASQLGYSPDRIGIYVQPQHQGVSQHVEFTIPYDAPDKRDTALAENLFTAASESLTAKGAYFSRPYGPWADLVYSRDATATRILRDVKQIVDPNHILNPGKLCF